MPTDRDAYDLEPSTERKTMLEQVLRGRVYTWAGTPLRKDVPAHEEAYDIAHTAAYKDLVRAGLVVGEHITGRGHRAAVDWGLIREPAKRSTRHA